MGVANDFTYTFIASTASANPWRNPWLYWMAHTARPLELVDEAVDAGMVFLDDKVPGWLWSIDLDRLDVRIDADCLLGQLHPGGHPKWSDGFLNVWGRQRAPEWLIRMGFAGSCEPDAKRLTVAWKHRIKMRRFMERPA